MIFIDRSIPRSVADGLKRVRGDVIWLEDRFAPDVPDSEWLAEAGREGWLVITRDKRIRHRPAEKDAIREHGVGCFVLGHRKNLTREAYLSFLPPLLDEMERLFAETSRPFVYVVDSAGAMRQVALER